MIDYCAAIAALFAESYKLPRITTDTDREDRRRIEAIHASLHRQQWKLQAQAAKEFAAINNWRHTDKHFSIKTLIRGGTQAARGEYHFELHPHALLDHPEYFREPAKPYRPVAIVGQPYDTATSVDKGTELAHSLGFVLHVPPNLTASWWYPGRARFFCIARPGVAVRFLPDQLTFKSHGELVEVAT